MEGRYLYLNRNLVKSEIQNLIAKENTINTTDIPSNSLAIFPLNYYGLNKKYEPLSRGFSEMISIDLAKVKKLTVLERIRLKAVMDELKFSKSSLVDQSSAPRMGKLLRARLLYSGSFNITDNDNLKMDLNSWDINTSKSGDWLDKTGKLDDFFLIEKELVFDIINQLGIALSQEEKEQILLHPTENIEAFLEYSKGLQMQDNGLYNEAALFFSNAVEIDPNFHDALIKNEESLSIGSGSGITGELLGRSEEIITGVENIGITGTEDIILNRLDVLSGDIRSGFEQGFEKREAPQEAASSFELPMPPPRPDRK
jgi:hypothetical protein